MAHIVCVFFLCSLFLIDSDSEFNFSFDGFIASARRNVNRYMIMCVIFKILDSSIFIDIIVLLEQELLYVY